MRSPAKPKLDGRPLLDDIYRRAAAAGYERIRLDRLLDVAEAGGGVATVMQREADTTTDRRSRLRILNRKQTDLHSELHGLVGGLLDCNGDGCKSKRPLLKTHAAFLQQLHQALFDAEASALMLIYKTYGYTDGADTLGGVIALLRSKLGLSITDIGFLRTVHRCRRTLGRDDLPDEQLPSVVDQIVKDAAHAASVALSDSEHDAENGVSKGRRVRVRSDKPSRKE